MTPLGKLIARRLNVIEREVKEMQRQIDRYCLAERHKECAGEECGCACHTKEKITPLKDLLNQDLFK